MAETALGLQTCLACGAWFTREKPNELCNVCQSRLRASTYHDMRDPRSRRRCWAADLITYLAQEHAQGRWVNHRQLIIAGQV